MSTSAMVGSGETDATNLKIQLFKDDRQVGKWENAISTSKGRGCAPTCVVAFNCLFVLQICGAMCSAIVVFFVCRVSYVHWVSALICIDYVQVIWSD